MSCMLYTMLMFRWKKWASTDSEKKRTRHKLTSFGVKGQRSDWPRDTLLSHISRHRCDKQEVIGRGLRGGRRLRPLTLQLENIPSVFPSPCLQPHLVCPAHLASISGSAPAVTRWRWAGLTAELHRLRLVWAPLFQHPCTGPLFPVSASCCTFDSNLSLLSF